MSARNGIMAAAALILFTSVYANFFLGQSGMTVSREDLSGFPKLLPGWTSEDQSFPNKILENLGVDEYLMRRFSNGKESFWLYIGYYKDQKEGTVPHSPRHCYPGSGFVPVRSTVIAIPVNAKNQKEIRPNLYIFGRGRDREVVIYWYQSRGRVIANEYIEKIYLIRDAIVRGRSDGGLVRFSMSATESNETEVQNRLVELVRAVYPLIPVYVPD